MQIDAAFDRLNSEQPDNTDVQDAHLLSLT